MLPNLWYIASLPFLYTSTVVAKKKFEEVKTSGTLIFYGIALYLLITLVYKLFKILKII